MTIREIVTHSHRRVGRNGRPVPYNPAMIEREAQADARAHVVLSIAAGHEISLVEAARIFDSRFQPAEMTNHTPDQLREIGRSVAMSPPVI